MADAALTILKWVAVGVLLAAIVGFVAVVGTLLADWITPFGQVIDVVSSVLPPVAIVLFWSFLAALMLPFAYKMALKIFSLF